MSDQDRPLVERVLRGDLDAFTALVKRYESALINYVYWIVLNEQDAKDVCQEVFFKVYVSLDKYDPEFKFSTWLFAIAKNAAIDSIRRAAPFAKKRILDQTLDESNSGEGFQLADPHAKSPEEAVIQEELEGTIEAAINGLPLPYREVLILRHLNELAYEDIAVILEIPLGTVKNRLFRARELLRERLQK